MTQIDNGHTELEKIIDRVKTQNLADANEAETRLKVINEIITQVLGWQLNDISVEERVGDAPDIKYCDYVLRTAVTTILIEAKKMGATFLLPTNRKSLKLGGVLSEGEVGDAIRQARDYCREKSIPFTVVTNGNVWIVFPSIRTDEIPFSDSIARIFSSLEDIRTRFVEFWELLSRERVAEGNLDDKLLGRAEERKLSRCIRDLLPEPGFRLGRNSLYEHLEPAIAAALTDEALLQDTEALTHCYVKTSERLKYDNRLRMYLSDPRPPLGQTSSRLTERGPSDEFTQTVAKSVVLPPRFILLLGPVGAGKTTFLRYSRVVSAEREITGKILWMPIDFKKISVSFPLRTFIYSELLRLIEEDAEFDLGDWDKAIRPAYRDEAERLKRGVLKPLVKQNMEEFELKLSEIISKEREQVEPYVERLLRYSTTKRPLYIIFDNVDQFEGEDFQAAVFMEAQALIRRTNANAIMCLRESTYLKQRMRPLFDAFQYELFYLDPPSILPVLARRFEYARRFLKEKAVDLITESGIRLKITNLADFFKVIIGRSLLSARAGQMLEVLSGGDIRRGLMLVREFLSSGHTNSDRAVFIFLKDGNYQFPVHEIFKGAILGNRLHYDDRVSLVPNIYDAKLGMKGIQLLRFRIIARFVEASSLPGFEGLSLRELLGVLGQMGASERDIDITINMLCRTRLLRTADGLPPTADSRLLPTRLSAYLIRVAATEFNYNEFCSIDTVIFNDDVWDKMAELTRAIEAEGNRVRKMEIRIERIKLYLDYIIKIEEAWIVEASRRKLGPEWLSDPIKSANLSAIERNLHRVIDSAKTYYGQ